MICVLAYLFWHHYIWSTTMLNLLHESGVFAFKGNPYLICFASIMLLHDVMGIIESFWGMAWLFILNKLNNCFLGCRYKLRNIEETEAAKKLLQEKRLMGRPKSEFSIPSSYSADYFQRGRDYAEKLRRGCWLFLIILHPFIIWVDWFFTLYQNQNPGFASLECVGCLYPYISYNLR